jgi:hypothetical protein
MVTLLPGHLLVCKFQAFWGPRPESRNVKLESGLEPPSKDLKGISMAGQHSSASYLYPRQQKIPGGLRSATGSLERGWNLGLSSPGAVPAQRYLSLCPGNPTAIRSVNKLSPWRLYIFKALVCLALFIFLLRQQEEV